MTRSLSRLVITLAIAAAVLAAFWPALSCDFVRWDDDINFLNNPHFRGLGWTQLRWMFSTFLGGHYIPATWLTLGADFELWGMDPFGYHLTSVLFHAANSVLLFFVLRQLCQAADRAPDQRPGWSLDLACAAGALLFALHPLRVESVAWVTERRDVVSGLFGLAFLSSYLRYVGAPAETRRSWYAACLAGFFLMMLARPNCVTLLGAALILDFFPLNRLPGPGPGVSVGVLAEKIPLLLLSLAGVAAVVAANAAIGTLHFADRGGPLLRATQACLALHVQIKNAVFPMGLSPIYGLALDAGGLARTLCVTAAPLVLATLILFLVRKRWPAGLAAWTYYLLMLAPAHGSVDTWSFTNDRYSYMACWAWSALLAAGLWRLGSAAAGGLCLALLLLLGGLSRRQCLVWHDTVALWRQAAAVGSGSPEPFRRLGDALAGQGAKEQALAVVREGLALYPRSPRLLCGLALLQHGAGQDREALASLRTSLSVSPDYAEPCFIAEDILGQSQDKSEALAFCAQALRGGSSKKGLSRAAGRLYFQQGELARALPLLAAAVAEDPQDALSYDYIGLILSAQGRPQAAAAALQEAIRLKPDFAEAMAALGNVYAQQGRLGQALAQYEAALRLQPELAEVQFNAAVCLTQMGRRTEAQAHFKSALGLRPDLRSRQQRLEREGF